MNILLCSDNNGVDMLLVAMYSVIKNNANVDLDFFIAHVDIDAEGQRRISTVVDKFKKAKVNFIRVDSSFFKGVELTNKAVSMPAYYRYLAPEILPKQEKVLYMDIDMLCIGSLSELYDTTMEGYYLAAVEDYFVSRTDDYPGFKKGIGFASNEKYANSGLLLMNLAKMRQDMIMERFWHNIHHKNQIIPAKFNIFADQTVTNLTFKGKIKFVSAKYNVLTTAMKYTKPKTVTIAHFAGPDKPFTYRDEYSAVYNDLYYEYYNECMTTVGDSSNRMIKNTLKRLGREATDATRRADAAERLARDKTHHVLELAEELENTRIQLKDLKRDHNAVVNSLSWKITKPLRRIARMLR